MQVGMRSFIISIFIILPLPLNTVISRVHQERYTYGPYDHTRRYGETSPRENRGERSSTNRPRITFEYLRKVCADAAGTQKI